MRPIEYFLSHQNGDRADIVELEGALRRRGLASWRDRRSLLAGDDNDARIRTGIDRETTGFLIYGSDRIVGSWYVWQREWPWAHARREQERTTGHPSPYRIVPLFVDGLDYHMLRHAAVSVGQPDPTSANGEQLRRLDSADRDRVARWLMRGGLADRAALHSEALKIRVTTFAGADDADADVLVDWSPELADDPVDWPLLQNALYDLKDELARLRRPIEVDVQARLVAAFVFGHAFPLASRLQLAAIHRDGSRWMLGSASDPSLVDVDNVKHEGGDPSVAVIQVSLTRDVDVAAAAALRALSLNPGQSTRIGYADGVSEVDARVAAAASFVFGAATRGLRDDGVREAHLFIATPAALAMLLGASANAGPAMSLYFVRDGCYLPALRLPA